MDEPATDESLSPTFSLDNTDLRVILAGVGGFGQVWAGLNRADLGLRVVAIADPDPGVLSVAGDEWGLSPSDRFGDVEEALSVVPADILLDSSPPEFHSAHALAAFQRGVHVFTAKPLALRWEDALEMSRQADRASLLLGVNEQLRFGWLPLALSSAIEAGEIGAVESVEFRFREPSAWQGWRAEMEHPMLLDAAVQHFDMVRAVTGLEPESVFCRAWRRSGSSFAGAGSAAALFRMSRGVPFTYVGTWEQPLSAGDTTGWWGEWRIQGSRGELLADASRGVWLNGAPYPVGVEPLDVRRLSLVVLDQFVRAVRTGANMPTNAWSDLRSLAMCELCIRSARAGAPVMLKDLDPALPDAAGPDTVQL